MRTLHLFLVLFLFPLCGYLNAQWASTITDNIPVCVEQGNQHYNNAITDGFGGVYFIWNDHRTNTIERYVKHIDANGNTSFPVNGKRIGNHPQQIRHQSCTDGDGNLFVAIPSGANGVFLQKVTPEGGLIWGGGNGITVSLGMLCIDINILNGERSPAIIYDGNGGIILTAERNGSLVAQKYDSTGLPVWNSTYVTLVAGQYSTVDPYKRVGSYPKLCSDGSGGAFIAYFYYTAIAPYGDLLNLSLIVQRITVSGNLAFTAPGAVVTTTMRKWFWPQDFTIISDGNGNADLAWIDTRDSPVSDIYAQKVSSTGNVLWGSSGLLLCDGWWNNLTGNAVVSAIRSVNNSTIFLWNNNIPQGATYMQRVSSIGNTLLTTNGRFLNTSSTLNQNYVGNAVSDQSGGFILAWELLNYNYLYDVMTQRYDKDGIPLWDIPGEVVSLHISRQRAPFITTDGAHGAIVIWIDGRNSATGSDLYTGRWNADGTLFSNSPPTANAGADQLIECGNTVTLDGAGSSDPDNDALTYTWIEGSTVLYTGTSPSFTATLAIGTHYIDLTVEDPSNETSTDQVVITVEDTQAPVITCKPATVTLVAGSASITTNDVDDGTMDACSAFTLSVVPSTFTCADIGQNTVTLSATDAFNNTSTCTATVTVDGALPAPTITVDPSPTVVNHAEETVYLGFGPQTVTLIASGGLNDTYSWSPATNLSNSNIYNPVFSVDADGEYTYTVTVTNQYGCSGTATVTLQVLDWRCSNNANNVKIMMCHQGKTICVSEPAVQAHLNLGDYIGSCQVSKSRSSVPNSLSISQNYPNPFNPTTVIEYEIPEDGDIQITIFDLFGREVDRLVNGFKQAGTYNLAFDGSSLPSGVYVYRLEWNGKVISRRMTLLK